MENRKYKYSLKKKIVFGICSVAAVTYATSAFFMFVMYDILVDLIPMNYNVFVSLTLFLGVVWCGIFGLFLATYIVKPIRVLEEVARKVASGDISTTVRTPKSDDELRALAKSYNAMILGLRGMVEDINENFKETNERVEEIKGASSSAASQAENISKNVEEISLGAEGSALAITETVSSMDIVTSIAQKVQENALHTERLSTEMEHTLQESRQDVESLVKGIQDIASNNEQSLAVVQRLERHANKVGEILSLVGDVAEQTNLLALNASIEAARAGEHGRGFAVVADEVRKLADESANAVQGITELIGNIQDEVRNVVQQIETQVKTANIEAKKGVKTNESIEGMSVAGLEVAQSIDQILALIQEQMVSIEGTARQSEEVAAIAEETSAGALEVSSATQEQTAIMEEIAASAELLGGQAERLKETIGKFTY